MGREPFPPFPVTVGETAPPVPTPPRRITTSAGLNLVGAVPGLALSAIPTLLIYQYVEVFTAIATPDSPFNVYILGALACSLVAGLLRLCAFVSLFFRQTRVIGIGYLCGMLLVVLALVVSPLAT